MKLIIGIIDYGIGNWSSIKQTLSKLGYKAIVSSDHDLLTKSDLILLPGVGAFNPAMKAIEEKNLDKLIYKTLEKNKPILGICLGMQLLGRSSQENEYTTGLNIISEDVFPLEENSCHIGWNSTICIKEDSFLKNYDNCNFYFNHSYAFSSDLDCTICETTYKKTSFSSIIVKDKVAGLQFHPEKSQFQGTDLLKKLILGLC